MIFLNGLTKIKRNNMEEIFLQAKADKLSTRLVTNTSEAYIYKGVKIIKEETGIRIMNTKFNGDYYTDVTTDQYRHFMTYGWRVGCYIVANQNNNRSLINLNAKLKNEKPGTKTYTSILRNIDVVIERTVSTLNLLQHEFRQQLQN